MIKSNEKVEKLLAVIFPVLALCVIVPVMIGGGYTYLCEDDFSFEGGANDMARIWGSGLVGGMVRAYEYYMSTQGTYVFNSTIHLLRVYTRWGLPGFHVFMIALNIAFAGSLFYLMGGLFKRKFIAGAMFFASAVAVYQTGNCGVNRELFYWYTGALNYTLGLTLAFFALGALLRYVHTWSENKKVTAYLVLSAVLAFFASGVALEITSPNCALLLAVAIVGSPIFIENRKIIIPFISAFAGALFNVIAPGNYPKTYEHMAEGHSTVFDAFKDTVICYRNEAGKIFGSPIFLMVLACVLTGCVLFKVKIVSRPMTGGLLALTLVGSILVQYFTAFPVCFGYHSDSLIVMRTTAAYELIAKMMYIFMVVCLAQWIMEKEFKAEKVVVICAIAAALLFCIFSGKTKEDIKNGFSFMSARDFVSGSMQEAYKTRSYVLMSLELAQEGSDAYIVAPLLGHPESTYGMGLTEDPSAFVNQSAAGLYHLNSVTVVYTE